MAQQHSPIDIRRAADRFATTIDWLDSKHSFSFNRHHNPANTHHGLLIVSNDDVVKPGTGFQTHPHQDMEIITWVLDGQLEHTDSEGHTGVIYPGLAQRMSAGTGIWHSEINATDGSDVHFLQMWVPPDTEHLKPGYEQLDTSHEIAKGGLVPVASGRGSPLDGHAAISIRQKDAVLWAGKLKPGERVTIPYAPFVHLYVARGALDVDLSGADLSGAGLPASPLSPAASAHPDAGRLHTGDALRLTNPGALGAETTEVGALAATADPTHGAELLIWEMGATLAS